jgi:hypothetical protein
VEKYFVENTNNGIALAVTSIMIARQQLSTMGACTIDTIIDVAQHLRCK